MKYSIITPVYNREDSILRCLESITRCIDVLCRNGEEGMVEHIIVDDGSADSTPTIVEKYASEHSHVKFIPFTRNQGTNAARNAAIRAARSEWCILLDSDDYFANDALLVISQTMRRQPSYLHYMFAPDDMLDKYKSNPIIQGQSQVVLTYENFLRGEISGDFTHVCNTAILRKYPFNEQLRIYEGTFFLMFFREAHQMLFTNHVVSHRERNRADSVTRETIRTNMAVVKRGILSAEIYLQHFQSDLEAAGFGGCLHSVRARLLENYVLAGQRDKALSLYKQLMPAETGKKDRLLHIINTLHFNGLYRLALKGFLLFKYKVMRRRLE